MSLFNLFNISGSAMTAQSQRLNVVASNLANADSATSSTGQPYRAKQVVFSATPLGGSNSGSAGVKVARVIEDPSPMKMHVRPETSAGGCQGLCHHAQCQCGGGNGQHDFGLAFVPEQCGRDEYGENPAA